MKIASLLGDIYEVTTEQVYFFRKLLWAKIIEVLSVQ